MQAATHSGLAIAQPVTAASMVLSCTVSFQGLPATSTSCWPLSICKRHPWSVQPGRVHHSSRSYAERKLRTSVLAHTAVAHPGLGDAGSYKAAVQGDALGHPVPVSWLVEAGQHEAEP